MTVCTVLSLSEEEISLFLEFELAEETLSGVLLQETSKAQMQTIQIIFKSFIGLSLNNDFAINIMKPS